MRQRIRDLNRRIDLGCLVAYLSNRTTLWMTKRRRRLLPSAQGCARQRATLGNQDKTDSNPERVVNSFGCERFIFVNANSTPIGGGLQQPLQGCDFMFGRYPGSRATRVNPGLVMVNAFGVHVRDAQAAWMPQVCHCP